MTRDWAEGSGLTIAAMDAAAHDGAGCGGGCGERIVDPFEKTTEDPPSPGPRCVGFNCNARSCALLASSTWSSHPGPLMSAYPNRFSPVYTENLSSVSPPRPMKHVYAACRLIGIDSSSTEPVNSCGHLISRDPRSSMYSASSGNNQMRFHRSACPIDLK